MRLPIFVSVVLVGLMPVNHAIAQDAPPTTTSRPTTRADLDEAKRVYREWWYKAKGQPTEQEGRAIAEAFRGGGDDAEVIFWAGESQERGWFDTGRPLSELFLRSATLGSTRAKVVVAVNKIKGTGLPQDVQGGMGMLQEALDAGEPNAASSLGEYFLAGPRATRNLDEAERYLKQGIEMGDLRAYIPLAALYRLENDPQHYLEAIRASAEAGDVRGQIELADAYHDGKILKRNPREELRWRVAAANQGDAASTREIAKAFDTGYGGLRRDHEKATSILDTAVKLGDKNAKRLRALAKIKGDAFAYDRDPEEGLKELRAVSDAGDAEATRQLAELYIDGIAVDRDVEQAKRLLRKAADAGNAAASARLNELNAQN